MSDDTPTPETPERGEPVREIKVTDRRMFTADGELREEYKNLDERTAETPSGDGVARDADAERLAAQPASAMTDAPAPSRATAPSGGPGGVAPAPGMPGMGPQGGPAGEAPTGAPVEIPSTGAGPAPQFLDLVALLAEPVALYLGDAPLPDGGSAENLDAARLHIDLLDVLRQKTAGNLSAQESGILEDVLYRLRMRYVQKRG